MSLSLLLALVISGAPAGAPAAPPKGSGPTAAETAKLFFLAGDVLKAQEWARRGLQREPKTCGPIHKALAEYAFLLNHVDEFTPEQAKQFFELDAAISPTVRGKLTQKAYEKHVLKPLSLAKSRADGDVPGATQLLDRVLAIEPKNADALALRKSMTARDGGK